MDIFFGGIEQSFNVAFQFMGASTMLINFFVIVVFLKNPKLRERHLFIALAVGDFFEGIYFAYGGFSRLKEMENGTYYDLVSPRDCAMKFYATFQLVGIQLPMFASLMISIERVLAVTVPFWYYAKFTKLHRFGLLFISILICTISLIVYFLTVLPLTEKIYAYGFCGLTFSSHPLYNSVHQVSVVVIQIASLSLSTFAFFQAWKKGRAVAAMRKEAQNGKSIFAVSLISVILITTPQIYLFLFNQLFGDANISPHMLFIIITLPCINSFSNFIIYLGLMKEFRSEVSKILNSCRCRKTGIVAPMNVATARVGVVAVSAVALNPKTSTIRPRPK